jgi:hypothetical protein
MITSVALDPITTIPQDGLDILGLLAWCASAAGVAGLLFTGTLMALQLRRGEPGEHAVHLRGVYYVLVASVLATTAGPIIHFLGPFLL